MVGKLKEFFLNEKDDKIIRNYIISSHPYDMAQDFKELEEDERSRLYKILSNDEIANIFEYLDEEDAADYLEEMDTIKSSSILNEMDIDDAVDIVNELEEPDKIVNLLEEDVRDDIDDLSVYNSGTAGAVMTTNYIEINPDMDVKDAMKTVVANADEKEIIDSLFVCFDGVLVGTLDLKDLIVARSPNKISDIMKTNFMSCNVEDDIEEVNKIINNYDIYALPVLEKNILRGIITIDDAFDAIEDSMKQDYKQMAAISTVEKGDSILKLLMKRIPWLVVLLIFSLIVSNVINVFDEVITKVIVLAFFQTMLLDMAGNIGTQSLAVTIQKMTNDELDNKKQELKHILREIEVNTINSLLLGVMSFIVSILYLHFQYHGEYNIYLIALVISLSLFLTLLVSGFFATILPLLLRKIKIDPAVASGPFISTLNDIVSIVIYFNLAILILGLVI